MFKKCTLRLVGYFARVRLVGLIKKTLTKRPLVSGLAKVPLRFNFSFLSNVLDSQTPKKRKDNFFRRTKTENYRSGQF